MNHRNKVKKIGKDHKHKKAMLRNMTLSILKHEKIKTTLAKAKVFRSFIEPIITRSRTDNLHNRRLIYRHVKNTLLLKKLFEDIAVRYKNRKGGYIQLIKIGQRKGDAAQMCTIAFVEEKLVTEGSIKDASLKKDKDISSVTAEVTEKKKGANK